VRVPFGLLGLPAGLLVLLGIGWHDGDYGTGALVLVVAGFALACVAVAGLRRRIAEGPATAIVAVTLLGWSAGTVFAGLAGRTHPFAHGFAYGASRASHVAAGLGLALAVGTVLAVVRRHPDRAPAAALRWLWLLTATGLLADVLWVLASPDPHIDVFTLLQDSSTGLVHGADLYRQHWPGSPGLTDVYPYLPATTLLLAPFRWATGDVRAGLCVALLVAVFVASRLLRRAGSPLGALALLVPALLVVAPRAAWALGQSWTEPLVAALLLLATLGGVRDRGWLAVLGFGLALAVKQHVVLLLPVALAWRGLGPRRCLAAIGVAALVVLPWFVAGPADLWHDAVTFNLDYAVLPLALDLPSWGTRHGLHLGFGLTAAFVLLAEVLAVRLARAEPNPAGFLLGSGLVLIALDVTNKQSFYNHYWLAAQLLVLGAATAISPVRAVPGRGPRRAGRP
jgi:hypothetical protein